MTRVCEVANSINSFQRGFIRLAVSTIFHAILSFISPVSEIFISPVIVSVNFFVAMVCKATGSQKRCKAFDREFLPHKKYPGAKQYSISKLQYYIVFENNLAYFLSELPGKTWTLRPAKCFDLFQEFKYTNTKYTKKHLNLKSLPFQGIQVHTAVQIQATKFVNSSNFVYLDLAAWTKSAKAGAIQVFSTRSIEEQWFALFSLLDARVHSYRFTQSECLWTVAIDLLQPAVKHQT
jgi:hypothetical protein